MFSYLETWIENVEPLAVLKCIVFPGSKAPEANMGPVWGRQNPGGPYVGCMNFAIWVGI